MAKFTDVFVGVEDTKWEDGFLNIKKENGSVDIKEECDEEKDPLSITSQSAKGKKGHKGRHNVLSPFVWDVNVLNFSRIK